MASLVFHAVFDDASRRIFALLGVDRSIQSGAVIRMDQGEPIGKCFWHIVRGAFEERDQAVTQDAMIFGVKVLPATGAGCGECEVEMAGQTQVLALPFRADQGRFKLMHGELLEQAVLADDADQAPGRVDHRDVAQVVAGHGLQRGADRLVKVDIAQRQTHALIKPDRLWFGVLIKQA